MTLIEVLIAAVVIGIGLLGVAALQVSALQGSSNAQYRSKATDTISNLSDRIRANPEGRVSYISAAAGGDCDASAPNDICAMAPDAVSAAGIADCTPAQLAAHDLWEVRCDLEDNLPGGQLSVSCDGACPELSQMQISVTWQVQETTAGITTQNVTSTIIPGVPSGPPI
jgi:type IV pilus assembly protein PilV